MPDPRRRHNGQGARAKVRRLGYLTAALVGTVTLLVALRLGVFAPAQRERPEGRREPELARGDEGDREAGYELEDVQPRGLVLALAAILGMVALLFVVITVYLAILTGRPVDFRPPVMGLADLPQSVLPPEPRLETRNAEILDQLQAREKELLETYGWLDQARGVVHIPIERAMQLTAERGLPTRPEAERAGDQRWTMPSDASSGRMPEEIVP